MDDRRLLFLLRTILAAGGGLAVAGSIVFFALGETGTWWEAFFGFLALIAVSTAVITWLIAPRNQRSVVVWTLAAACCFSGLAVGGVGVALLVVDDPTLVVGGALVPAALPTSAAWIMMFAGPAYLGLYPALTLGLLLFPDGALPSRRWRPIAWFASVSLVATTVVAIWSYRPTSVTVVEEVEEGALFGSLVALLMIAVVLSLSGLIVRFRSSSGDTKERMKWVVWGATVFSVLLTAGVVSDGGRFEALAIPLLYAGAIAFVVSYGIAIGRHRLFDIDVVIRRTAVVAGLAGLVTLVYAGVVGGIGLLFGSRTDSALPLSIAATVVVAVAFQPVQQRMRAWANRLVYGERATPYEVLSRFAARMRDTVATEEVVPQLARLLADGTSASVVVVWIIAGDELQPAATWPPDSPLIAPMPVSEGALNVAGFDHVAPVEHDGELLGAVAVTVARGDTLATTDIRLIDDVASQAGLVLRNAHLIHELRSSRQRLVAAQDQERRRLERDLHDGAQQQLVALKLKLRLVQKVDDEDKRDELFDALVRDADDAIEGLRNLARGIYPPVLIQRGLVAALRAHSAKAVVATEIEADDLGRYPPEIESAVYFCVLEALQNVAKYAGAGQARVGVTAGNAGLKFEIVDDGRGFDVSTVERGAGLQNMEDRIEALGGSVTIRSAIGVGTEIVGVVPARMVPANKELAGDPGP